MKKIVFILAVLITVTLTGCEEKSDNTLTVLTSSGYQPYEMVDTSGNLTGFDIELMEALGEEIGMTIEWKDVDFNGIIGSLQSKQYEVAIAGITPTEDRKASVDFSDVYYNSESGLQNYMVVKTSANITSLDDLNGLVVGVQLGTVQDELANKLALEHNFTVESRNTNTQIVEEIKSDIIDVLIVESNVADAVIAANDSLSKVKIETSLDDITGNAIAFMKDSVYLTKFNDALATLAANGTLDQLIEKWFGVSE